MFEGRRKRLFWVELYSCELQSGALGAMRLCKSKICARRAIGAISAGEQAPRHELA